jgi:hypothetical protein
MERKAILVVKKETHSRGVRSMHLICVASPSRKRRHNPSKVIFRKSCSVKTPLAGFQC